MINDSPRAIQIRSLIDRHRQDIARKRKAITKAQAAIKDAQAMIVKRQRELKDCESATDYRQFAIPVGALSARARWVFSVYEEGEIKALFAKAHRCAASELLRLNNCGVGTFLEIAAFAFTNGWFDQDGIVDRGVTTWGAPRWHRALAALQDRAVGGRT